MNRIPPSISIKTASAKLFSLCAILNLPQYHLTHSLELVQNQRIRFLSRKYSSFTTVCELETSLKLSTLNVRRKLMRLCPIHLIYCNFPFRHAHSKPIYCTSPRQEIHEIHSFLGFFKKLFRVSWISELYNAFHRFCVLCVVLCIHFTFFAV